MLFTDPRSWTENAVGTWPRFWFLALGNAALIAYAVYVAASESFMVGIALAGIPITQNILYLYALRRLYRQASGFEAAVGAV